MNVPLPPVVQQRKHKWEDISYHGSPSYECDICGASEREVDWGSVCEGPEAKKRRREEQARQSKVNKVFWNLVEVITLCEELGVSPQDELTRVKAKLEEERSKPKPEYPYAY